MAFKLLAEDPESRLVIYFHGNAGTVAQGWRTDTYRVLASAQPAKIHVMAIDYRGFGKSTGSPNEQGLIQDGITLVRYAMETVGIAPERIVLVGQSLGSAVATAVVEWFTRNDPSAEFYEWPIEFKGLVLVAAFSDIPTLMLTYTIGGIIPILSPLRPYPFLQRFFAKGIQETWLTSTRLANLVRRSKNVELHLIHSKDDFEIPWSHSDTLFHAAANATSEKGLTSKQIESLKSHTDLGDYGQMNYWQTVQKDGGRKMIYQTIVNQGGRSRHLV